jgi:DNA-binding XRE family transcriptional regulator
VTELERPKPFGFRPVEPIGTRTAYAHVNRGDKPHYWGPVEFPDFPPSPEGDALRELRMRLRVTLREAAQYLGLSAVDVSALERGAATAAWPEVFQAIADAVRNAHGEKS